MTPDTHCHLDLIELDTKEVVRRAVTSGVSPIITVGIDVSSSEKALKLSLEHEAVFSSVGIHPNGTNNATGDDLERIEELSRRSKRVVAIGETGLDFYRKTSSPEQQIKFFVEQIKLAKKTDKALIVHSRNAYNEVLDILEKEKAQSLRAVIMHCFSADLEVLKKCIRRGFRISFAGPITFRNAENSRFLAKNTPLELLLCETDSPFLSPEPHRGKPNLPERVKIIAAELARIHSIDEEEMQAILRRNACETFGIEDMENGKQ